ncbi:MAG: hypothetical protein KY443_03240 [Actinobacteria bacterium]|nr:hypothetical protein [Actinomycetota bacterium]
MDQHDDNHGASLYDLQIRYSDRPPAAVEVTAAADAASIELWKIVNGRDERWQAAGIAGGWAVSLLPTARGKVVMRELPKLLADLEGARRTHLRGRRSGHGPLEARAGELGVVSAAQYGTDFPGAIYPTIALPAERRGGMVAETGDALSPWVAEHLLAHPDVLKKLALSGAEERHAFIILPGFSTAPFPVADLFMRQAPPLPTTAPELPPEVTHVWVVSTWTIGRGLRWSPNSGWAVFDKPDAQAA